MRKKQRKEIQAGFKLMFDRHIKIQRHIKYPQ